jgi:Zn-dependent protease with chaperone function
MFDLKVEMLMAVALPGLFLPVAIAWWKGRGLVPIALLSLVFWPGALVLALRLQRRREKHKS